MLSPRWCRSRLTYLIEYVRGCEYPRVRTHHLLSHPTHHPPPNQHPPLEFRNFNMNLDITNDLLILNQFTNLTKGHPSS